MHRARLYHDAIETPPSRLRARTLDRPLPRPTGSARIQRFCAVRYDVTFPLFAKIEVNGPGAHPLYAHLTSAPTAPDGPGPIRWNFAKFLVDREGNVVARYAPTEDPAGATIRAAIEARLA